MQKLTEEKCFRKVNGKFRVCCPITTKRRENPTAVWEDHVRLSSTSNKYSGFVGILIHSELMFQPLGCFQPL